MGYMIIDELYLTRIANAIKALNADDTPIPVKYMNKHILESHDIIHDDFNLGKINIFPIEGSSMSIIESLDNYVIGNLYNMPYYSTSSTILDESSMNIGSIEYIQEEDN